MPSTYQSPLSPAPPLRAAAVSPSVRRPRAGGTSEEIGMSESAPETSRPLGEAAVAERGFVQLLTPEGERVHDSDYDVHLTDAEYRSFFRDLVLVRRVDAEATALQRQGQLGLWASLL